MKRSRFFTMVACLFVFFFFSLAAGAQQTSQEAKQILDATGSARSADRCTSAYADTLNCEALARCLRFTVELREAGLGLEWRIG